MRAGSTKMAAKLPPDPYDYSDGNVLSIKRRAELRQDYSNQLDARDLVKLHAEDPAMYLKFLARAARRNGPLNCVYFIRMGETDAVKVGKAWNGLARCVQLQTSSPLKLDIVAFVSFIDEATMHEAEIAAHLICKYFDIGRLKGEWFNMSRERVKDVYEGLIDQYHGKIVGAVRKRAGA